MCSDCDFFSSLLHGIKIHKRSCTGEKSGKGGKLSGVRKRMYVCSDCDFSTTDESEMKMHNKDSCARVRISVSCQTEARVPVLLITPTSSKASIACQTEQNLTSTPLVVMARPASNLSGDDATLKRKVTVSCQTDEIIYPERKKDERIDCPYCTHSTTNKHNMKIHIKTHTGDKPHACTYCDKKFALKSNLVTHTRTHTGQRPFVCEVCSKSFASKSVLDRHRIRWHTEERPFVCEICFMGFKFKLDLKNHKKTHNFG